MCYRQIIGIFSTCAPLIFHKRPPLPVGPNLLDKLEIGNRKAGTMVLCYYSLIKALLGLEIRHEKIQKVDIRGKFFVLAMNH